MGYFTFPEYSKNIQDIIVQIKKLSYGTCSMISTLRTVIKSKLLTSAAIFATANVVDKGLPFLILPLLTHAMPPDKFALVALFTGIFAITNYSVGFSAVGYLGIAYFKKNFDDFKQIIFNSILIFITSSLLNFTILVSAPAFFGEKSGLTLPVLCLSILASLGTGIHSIILSIYRSKLEALPYAALQIARSLLDVGISLFLVLNMQMSWLGRIWGITSANILMGILSLAIIYHKKMIHFKISKRHLQAILFFGLPLFPHAIGNWALSMSDRFFINHYVGADENGKYALGFTLGMSLAVLTQSFNQAWAPYLFNILKKNSPSAKKNVVKITYFYFASILVFAVILSFLTKIILLKFFPPEYFASAQYILPISISYAFDGMYMMVTNYIFYSGKTYLVSLASGLVAIIKLSLSYFLIRNYGTDGAIYSPLISFFLLFLFTFIIAAKVEPMPWNLLKKIT